MKLEHIIEARYYRKHSVDSVHNRLSKLAGKYGPPRMELTAPVRLVSDKNVVTARFYLSDVDSKQEAINRVQSFLQKHGIPFTNIGNTIDYRMRSWRVTMTYAPDRLPDRLTEARYQPHGEISRKYAVYDPKTGLFPYTMMGLGLPRPKTSDTYNAADEARERIKEMQDQAIQFQQNNLQRHQHENVAFHKSIQTAIDAAQYYKVVEMIIRYAK